MDTENVFLQLDLELGCEASTELQQVDTSL